MSGTVTLDPYGELVEPATLTIQRLLPGPIERVWSYLTESDLRRQWFAAGDMTLALGAPLELVWRNDELTDPPGERPSGASAENRMQSRIVELEPPHRLAITWGSGAVAFKLEPRGSEVLLTLVHTGVPDRAHLLNFAPGWHTHLDILAARLAGGRPKPFWDEVHRLRGEYDRRLPA